jgi:hypothetical protein
MQYCVNHPEEINKLSKVKAHLSEVKGIMMDNIEKVCAGLIYHPDREVSCHRHFTVDKQMLHRMKL